MLSILALDSTFTDKGQMGSCNIIGYKQLHSGREYGLYNNKNLAWCNFEWQVTRNITNDVKLSKVFRVDKKEFCIPLIHPT